MPKPILSDSLFNADDVAEAILSKANLSITNENLGVSDITSSFVLNSNWNAWMTDKCFIFNGFVFVTLSAYISGSSSHLSATITNIYTINNSDYYPAYEANLVTASYQGDTAMSIKATTTGEINVAYPNNVGGDTNFHVVVNGFYRVN